VADEKYSWWLGERVYIAVTAAMGCFLGVGLSIGASGKDLAQADGEFAQEASAHQPDYRPQTLILDSWEGTQTAWRQLFPAVVFIPCFLHVVLGIEKYCRSNQSLHQALIQGLWHLYHSQTPAQFGQRLRRLWEWVKADPTVPAAVLGKLERFKTNAAAFKLTFEYPQAYRTSNPVDRLMNYQGNGDVVELPSLWA
jgi:hypothetical protein